MTEIDMTTPNLSPTLHPTNRRAPEPSAALLSLQDKGLELPKHRNTPTSISPQSNPAYDNNLRLSPLSIVSTPSILRPSPAPPPEPQESEHTWRRRTSSTASVETTVTNILNLYTNLSKNSFKSEYEEITADSGPDAGSSDDDSTRPRVHQPKAQAYRDTIAPLLEHQFSSTNLVVPGLATPMPSPMSLASMPTLMHPDASLSVPSFQLTLERSPSGTLAGLVPSDTSIQVTPEMSPPSNMTKAPGESPGRQASYLHGRRVNLEVPDVRDAESWYDEPLSPVSPEDLEYRNAVRDSQQSAVSPQSPNEQKNHFRALAFESLSPPAFNVKTSPGLRSVNIVDVEGRMVPPLDLSQSHSHTSRTTTPAHQKDTVKENGTQDVDGKLKGEHPDLVSPAGKSYGLDLDLSDGQTSSSHQRILVEAEQPEQTLHANIDEIRRPTSAFSDSSDSFVIYDTFSGQMKALFRDKFGKKKEKKSSARKSTGKEKEQKRATGPTMTKNVTTAFTDDVESYKYPYGLKHSSGLPEASKEHIQPAYRIRSHGVTGHLNSEQEVHAKSTTEPEKTTVADSSADMKALEQPAIPLTKYQKYGVEVWYESNKKKRRQERERLRKEAEKAEEAVKEAKKAQGMKEVTEAVQSAKAYKWEPNSATAGSNLRLSGPGPDKSQPGFYQTASHTHNVSSDSTDAPSVSTEVGDDASKRDSKQRKSGGGSMAASGYNNDLFEASGGKKKSGLASRLMMSSEEKRKRKVKESITIVGGAKMGGDSSEGRGLVKI